MPLTHDLIMCHRVGVFFYPWLKVVVHSTFCFCFWIWITTGCVREHGPTAHMSLLGYILYNAWGQYPLKLQCKLESTTLPPRSFSVSGLMRCTETFAQWLLILSKTWILKICQALLQCLEFACHLSWQHAVTFHTHACTHTSHTCTRTHHVHTSHRTHIHTLYMHIE